MGRLEGKVIVIVGGATGMGAATTRRAVGEGAKIFLGDTNLDAARHLAEEMSKIDGKMEVAKADQADNDAMHELIAAAARRFGRIDGLFMNGADVSPATMARDTDAVSIEFELWDRVLAVNLRGYMLGIRHAVPAMLKTGGGAILCTSSEASFTSAGTMLAYGVSKAGVNQLVRNTAARFGREGIRCNAIAPGTILMEIAKRNMSAEVEKAYLNAVYAPRLGLPEDIAANAVHLLSDDAIHVNGQVLSVNGGSYFQ